MVVALLSRGDGQQTPEVPFRLLELRQGHRNRVVFGGTFAAVKFHRHARTGDAVAQLMSQPTGNLMQQLLPLLAFQGLAHLLQLAAHPGDRRSQQPDFIMHAGRHIHRKVAGRNLINMLMQPGQSADQPASQKQGHRSQQDDSGKAGDQRKSGGAKPGRPQLRLVK